MPNNVKQAAKTIKALLANLYPNINFRTRIFRRKGCDYDRITIKYIGLEPSFNQLQSVLAPFVLGEWCDFRGEYYDVGFDAETPQAYYIEISQADNASYYVKPIRR